MENKQADSGDRDLLELLEKEAAEQKKRKRGIFLPLLASILLFLLFAAQYFWFYERNWVLQNPHIRPLLQTTCDLFSCTLPVTRNPALMQVTERYMNKHKEVDDAVVVQIIFENSAFFPQAYPYLQVKFTDQHDQIIAMRRFSPAEYLGDDKLAAGLLQPKRPVHVKLEFSNAVEDMHSYGFDINFL